MNELIWPFLIPVLTALVCCLLLGRPSRARRGFIAVSATGQFLLALYLTHQVLGHPPMVLHLGGWASSVGIVLVLDGLAGIMLCLSTFVSLICILFSYAEIPVSVEQPLRLPMMQLLMAGINLTFITGDLFNLFVAFEIMLIASYALLTIETNDRDIKEAFPYLAINIFGSSLFLATAGLVYALFGTLNLAQLSVRAAELEGAFSVQLVTLLLMFVFGLKAGIFPLYYWLPNSYPILPFSLGAFYSGLLTKVGIYVMLRMLCTVFPHTLQNLYTLLAWLAGLTMVLAVLGAVSRNYIRGILSFHIVSQVGYMVLAIGFFTAGSIAACVFYVVHHIIVKSSLFLIGGVCMFHNHTDNLARMGNLRRISPWLGVFFLCQAFSLAGIPPFSGFWGKFIILRIGVEQAHYGLVAAAALASILTLVSMLKIWMAAFWNAPAEPIPSSPAEGSIRAMTLLAGAMTLVSLGIGLGAEWFLQAAAQAADSLLHHEHYQQAVFSFGGKGHLP